MRVVRNPKIFMDSPIPNERRRHGRLRCDDANCCVGQVTDLSASGMRVLRRGRPIMEIGDQFKISIHPTAGEPELTLLARVVWIQREGFRKHVIGLAFAELDDVTRSRLSELARILCDQTIFRCA